MKRITLIGTHQVPVLGVLDVGEYSFRLRTSRVGDGAMWRAAMVRNAKLIAGAFGSTGTVEPTWAAEHSRTAWLLQMRLDRSRIARGEGSSYVCIQTAPDGRRRMVGQLSICGVDPDSGAGEMSAWVLADGDDPGRVAVWAGGLVLLDAFRRLDLPAVVAPVAVTNPGPARGVRALGFEKAATLRDQRTFAGEPTDHVLWVMRNSTASVGNIERAIA